MVKQALQHEFRIAKRRSRQFGVSLKKLEGLGMIGAYSYRPLNLIEYCLHEAAHLVTLGHSPREFSKLRRSYRVPLVNMIAERFELISPEAADQLEIDTARVTFVAGQRLGLWEDPDPFICSTKKNLSRTGWSERKEKVQAAFDCLKLDQWSGWVKCDEQASLVSAWFSGGYD